LQARKQLEAYRAALNVGAVDDMCKWLCKHRKIGATEILGGIKSLVSRIIQHHAQTIRAKSPLANPKVPTLHFANVKKVNDEFSKEKYNCAILLFETPCLYSDLIVTVTNSPFSHVAIIIHVYTDNKVTPYLLQATGKPMNTGKDGSLVPGTAALHDIGLFLREYMKEFPTARVGLRLLDKSLKGDQSQLMKVAQMLMHVDREFPSDENMLISYLKAVVYNACHKKIQTGLFDADFRACELKDLESYLETNPERDMFCGEVVAAELKLACLLYGMDQEPLADFSPARFASDELKRLVNDRVMCLYNKGFTRVILSNNTTQVKSKVPTPEQ